jgi:predicted small metal-binding protein
VLLLLEGRTGSKEMERISLASVKCGDLGMDCFFEVKGTTEQELIRNLIEHMESEHNIPVLTADVLFRIKKGIKK